MKWSIGLSWLGAIVIQSIFVVLYFAHYRKKAKPGIREKEYRFIDDESLRSYKQHALGVGGFGAATLWAVLPAALNPVSSLTLKLAATFLVVGIFSAGVFIAIFYNFYELAGRPSRKESPDQELSKKELWSLFAVAFIAITGVLQGAYFLLLGIWKVSIW